MNFIKSSLSQLGKLQILLPQLMRNEIRSCSTLAENVKSTTPIVIDSQISEPDKLYKRVELEIRGNEPAVIKSYCKFTTTAASHLGIEVGESWSLRKPHKERHTLLKCVHIYKKHRVQYEIRTYFHFMHLLRMTGSTCDTFLEYIERNLPEGVGMKVTKIEIERLPTFMLSPPTSSSAEN